MCGLFGWTLAPDAIPAKDMSILAAYLSYTAENRGRHSWGLITKNGGITKAIGSIRDGCTHELLDSSFVAGHTRAATHGDITVENAHPFHIGKLIGSHNGVLTNHKALNTKYGRKYEVDSQHIFAHLAESLPLTDLEGYGAVTYTHDDDVPDTVHFGKSSNSSLCIYGIGTPETVRGLVWGSLNTWIKEAFGIMRFKDFFEYDVLPDHAYKSVNYALHNDGNFKFASPYYEVDKQVSVISSRYQGNYLERSHDYWQNRNYGSWCTPDIIPNYTSPNNLSKNLKKKVLLSDSYGKGKIKKLLQQLSNAMGVKCGVTQLEDIRKTLKESSDTTPLINTSVSSVPQSGPIIQELPHVEDGWYDG